LAQLYLFLAALLTAPGVWVRLTGGHPAPLVSAFIFGMAVLGAAFLLSWAAEVSQKDISQALAVAILALIAVLPEYAVDMYFAWTAAKHPEYGHYAMANMTGANRLLVGIGWPAVVLLYALYRKRKSVKLEPGHRSEILFLGLATLYSVVIPLKGRLDLIDTVVFISIFVMYAWRAAKAEAHEPELMGPAKWLGDMPTARRRASAIGLFLYSGLVIFLSAEPFAESLVAVGREMHIDEFLLVQWLAPMASEAPEFIIALLWTMRGDAEAGLAALVSSKVNQWTLLVGSLPVAYAVGGSAAGGIVLDARQTEEFILTAAQTLLGLAVLVDLRFAHWEAIALFVLFALQFPFPQPAVRLALTAGYTAIALAVLVRRRAEIPKIVRAALAGRR